MFSGPFLCEDLRSVGPLEKFKFPTMAQLLPPPTPNRDFSREDDSDSDVSEDSAGACFQTFHIKIPIFVREILQIYPSSK